MRSAIGRTMVASACLRFDTLALRDNFDRDRERESEREIGWDASRGTPFGI
jgi:hypothetical protein